MSKYSPHINQFLQKSLEPEICRVNLRLASMEEFSYNTDYMIKLRDHQTRIIPVYDFLKEYTIGEEECSWEDLTNVMRIAGLGLLSINTAQSIIKGQ